MSVDYKLYCIGLDGHVESREDYYAPDDLAALDRAREICGPYGVEVWQGERLVASIQRDGAASFATTMGPHAD